MSPSKSAVAVILGSAFARARIRDLILEVRIIETPYGEVRIHRVRSTDWPAYVLFRHGVPHTFLPHQVPYRAQAWALGCVGCGAVLVTSSVGVLDRNLPLNEPLLVGDLLMLENRLPDGGACTLFVEPSENQGHLVVQEGLFSRALGDQIRNLADELRWPVAAEVVFGYVGGPRTKTEAENRFWARLGAQVNSMSLGPEVVLANELEIPVAGLVVGHKYSVPGVEPPKDETAMGESLQSARDGLERLVEAFLLRGRPVPFANQIYRFSRDRGGQGV